MVEQYELGFPEVPGMMQGVDDVVKGKTVPDSDRRERIGFPLQNEPGYTSGQVEIVSTTPAEAVTPQAAESDDEFDTAKLSQKSRFVGAIVGTAEGTTVGGATGT